jgi:hypothetical protein
VPVPAPADAPKPANTQARTAAVTEILIALQ